MQKTETIATKMLSPMTTLHTLLNNVPSWLQQWLIVQDKYLDCISTIWPTKIVSYYLLKYKRFKKIVWIQSHHLHLQWKLLAGMFTWDVKAKHWWVMSTNFLFYKVCCQHPAMFCLYTSSKLLCPLFESSLKVKVIGSNPGYLLKYFLL